MIKFIRLRWAGHVSRMDEDRNKIVIGKPTEKKPRRRWEDNIQMNLKEIGIRTTN